MLKLLVAVVLVAAVATPAAAVHYETFGKPFGGLGGTTPSGQFSDIVEFTTASGIADGPGTYLVDTIDFTVIRHGIAQTITKGVPGPRNYSGVMPPLGGAELSPDDVKAVAAYVWAISHNKG